MPTTLANPHVVFAEPLKVAVSTTEVDLDQLPPDKAWVQNEITLVSPGTELACLTGNESWAPLPFVPGYACVGRVVRAGAATPWKEGQRVFTMGSHARYTQTNILTVPVPDDLDPCVAAWVRLAGVAITAQRVADATLGDWVAVLGLGTVGNLAAQLFQLSGCQVIGIDRSPGRRARAGEVGVEHTLAPGDDLRERVAALTGGELCRTVVEATGVPAVAVAASSLAAQGGEVVLLGSPRGEHVADVTPMLRRIHLWGEGAITHKGALEWIYPVQHQPHVRHSMERNYRVLLQLLQSGKLHVRELITHIVRANEAPDIYQGLQRDPDRYLGVLFDWRD